MPADPTNEHHGWFPDPLRGSEGSPAPSPRRFWGVDRAQLWLAVGIVLLGASVLLFATNVLHSLHFADGAPVRLVFQTIASNVSFLQGLGFLGAALALGFAVTAPGRSVRESWLLFATIGGSVVVIAFAFYAIVDPVGDYEYGPSGLHEHGPAVIERVATSLADLGIIALAGLAVVIAVVALAETAPLVPAGSGMMLSSTEEGSKQ